MRGPLNSEVRQSLSLIVLTAVTMVVYIGLGLLTVRVFG
jgi:hypothetical protein